MKIHHIKFLCKDLIEQVNRFCGTFGFKPCGKWKDEVSYTDWIVLQKNMILFALGQDTLTSHDYVHDVALEVDSVPDMCSRTVAEGGKVILQPVFLKDKHDKSKGKGQDGVCEMAIMQSPVGNVRHTLLNRQGYKGLFLPGFKPFEEQSVLNTAIENNSLKCSITISDATLHLDHITFAVKNGTSFDFMKWYEKCLKFSRFKVNNEEKSEGFLVKTENNQGASLGMRLTAMQYHFCSEQCINLSDGRSEHDVKFVFAESLPGKDPNQIDTFLTENNGPGIQHIGLHTSDIVKTANAWKNRGAEFIVPPKHYYDEVKQLIDKYDCSQPLSLLEKFGILVDVEESGHHEQNKYLFQVFMKPMFDKNTFFFELIQRHGATGFGGGNIAALWRAVDAYLREQKVSEDTCDNITQ